MMNKKAMLLVCYLSYYYSVVEIMKLRKYGLVAQGK